jgi:hypothetical protein
MTLLSILDECRLRFIRSANAKFTNVSLHIKFRKKIRSNGEKHTRTCSVISLEIKNIVLAIHVQIKPSVH